MLGWHVGKFVRALSQKRGPRESRAAIRSAPDTGQHQQLLGLTLMFDILVLLKLNTGVELYSIMPALCKQQRAWIEYHFSLSQD